MRRALRAAWAAPRVPDAPGPLARDWALVAVVVVAALGEGLLRADIELRALEIVLVAAIAFTLPWRRVHPLPMLALGMGAKAVVVALVVASGWSVVGLTAGVFVLLLIYAVFRWGSGREAFGAVGVLVLVVALGFGRDYRSLAELLPELAILAMPALLAVAVRAQTTTRARDLERVRLAEREQLARELHDTVAHHVSAMVVRAQAGRVVGAGDPAAAIDALSVIEAEGARTLAEMRVLVGALRDSDDPALLAPRTAADIGSLARIDGRPTVSVSFDGDVDGLHPSVGAALYRIAQESVTNAVRHAVGATEVRIDVAAGGDAVRLRVVDDGEPVPADRVRQGYGIVGMAERVSLLGGTLTAGPGDGRGWVVDALVPRTGVRR
ncbi:MAG: sensor histidine kinase [Candidatus Nanopelagicales bacterium]